MASQGPDFNSIATALAIGPQPCVSWGSEGACLSQNPVGTRIFGAPDSRAGLV